MMTITTFLYQACVPLAVYAVLGAYILGGESLARKAMGSAFTASLGGMLVALRYTFDTDGSLAGHYDVYQGVLHATYLWCGWFMVAQLIAKARPRFFTSMPWRKLQRNFVLVCTLLLILSFKGMLLLPLVLFAWFLAELCAWLAFPVSGAKCNCGEEAVAPSYARLREAFVLCALLFAFALAAQMVVNNVKWHVPFVGLCYGLALICAVWLARGPAPAARTLGGLPLEALFLA